MKGIIRSIGYGLILTTLATLPAYAASSSSAKLNSPNTKQASFSSYGLDPSDFSAAHLRVGSTLRVNLDDSLVTVVNGAEANGIGQMYTLLTSQRTEEAWAYIPKAKIFVEIGKQSGFDSVQGAYGAYTTAFSTRTLKGLLEKHDATVYHIHPSLTQSSDDPFDAMLDILTDSSSPEGMKGVDLPSVADLVSTLAFTGLPHIPTWRVVTKDGVFSYAPNPSSALEKLKAALETSSDRLKFMEEQGIGTLDFDAISAAYRSSNRAVSVPAYLANELTKASNGFFSVEFVPFESLGVHIPQK